MEPRLPLSIPEDELESFNQLWRSLSPADQQALIDLFASAARNQAAVKHSGYYLTFHAFLLSLLVEHHKELMRLRRLVEEMGEDKSLDE